MPLLQQGCLVVSLDTAQIAIEEYESDGEIESDYSRWSWRGFPLYMSIDNNWVLIINYWLLIINN